MSVSEPPVPVTQTAPEDGGRVVAHGPHDPVHTAALEALNAGLEQIAARHEAHVFFVWEDPGIFGGGHLVLYTEDGGTSRFAIEEHYADPEWQDLDQPATAWTWVSETRVRQPDGDYPWVVLDSGEVEVGDHEALLGRAAVWTQRASDLAARADALESDPVAISQVSHLDRSHTLRS